LEQENPSDHKLANLHTGGMLTRVVNNVCTVYYARDASIMIGSIHYKMRMRKPILELIKWHKEKNQIIREISPIHDIMMKQVEKDLMSVNNYSKGKVMAVTVLLTKAIGLKTSGPPRKLMPYIYYQFYKFDEHFTKTVFGADPLFQDVKKYEIVYDNAFHEYIMYQNLEILVMDDSRQLEVEMKNSQRNNAVNLIDSPEYEDLIGIAKIPLKDLILNSLIQNNFPIYNTSGQFAGELVLNVFWEQVAIDSDENNKLPYEVKAWEENIVIQLADLMKHKGLNLNSAFEIFDRENKQLISLVNFRDTVLFTFNFTSKQEELEALTQLIFNGKTSLSKLDFYKIFAYLLPNDGITDNLITTHKTINNQVVEGINLSIVPENNQKVNQTQVQNISARDTRMVRSEVSFRKETNTDFKRDIKTQPNVIIDSNRTVKEIIHCINEYMIRTRKRNIVEVYKMFDKDANSFLDRHVIYFNSGTRARIRSTWNSTLSYRT
jgi:Ca2+-binding EF-hand superfamily protein